MSTNQDKVVISLENGIKRITINRSDRMNALDTETFKLLLEAIIKSARDESKVVVITGAGEAFSAGADLQARGEREIMKSDVTESLRTHVNPAIVALRNLPKPVIARVHGPAVGVGCNYALACDMIIASDQARFGQVFVKIGLMPDGGGTYFLPRIVGYQKAFELMALGNIISAQDALALGLINRVVPFDELDKTVNDLALRLAHAPSVALAKIKEGLNYGMKSDLSATLDFEAVNQGTCFKSQDFAEGVKAFIEKRTPQFRGH